MNKMSRPRQTSFLLDILIRYFETVNLCRHDAGGYTRWTVEIEDLPEDAPWGKPRMADDNPRDALYNFIKLYLLAEHIMDEKTNKELEWALQEIDND